MLFNSIEFIFFFLPISFALYFILNRAGQMTVAKAWLALASLFFYSWWNIQYLPLIVGSILFNYIIGTSIGRAATARKKNILILGICGNIALLGYFKYTDFLIANINYIASSNMNALHIILPLGISFFTFTQIAYLVDTYKGKAKEYSIVNYFLFVTFFPHLLAGPIIHHKEMMPQFDDPKMKLLNRANISAGLCLFFIGLFKKVAIADVLSPWVASGFDVATSLTLIEAWAVSLSYTFQIYFDFSGYTDMALGASLLFNIKLPINFNSPYKATSVQDFWRRWHITLSRFLRDYVYIPLGGNRAGEQRIYLNLAITFLVGGIWHGAGWTFVIWGALHGAAIIIHRAWQSSGRKMNSFLAWFLTFNFINASWVFFRAENFHDAVKVLKGMAGLSGAALPAQLLEVVPALRALFTETAGLRYVADGTLLGFMEAVIFLAASLAIALFFKNSNELSERSYWVVFTLVFAFAMQNILFSQVPSEFLYFRF